MQTYSTPLLKIDIAHHYNDESENYFEILKILN